MAFEEEVARGIALLDQKIPGWRQHVDADRLDMRVAERRENGCCILAQLYGEYLAGLEVIGLDGEDDSPYGFDDADAADYPALTNAWKRALGEEVGA